MVPGAGEQGTALNGYRVSVWADGKALEMDGDDGCTAAWMYLMPLK